jgi:hypothetical protein
VNDLVRVHLEGVAIRLGQLLRGFEDPAVHLGTAKQFAHEMAPLFDRPEIKAAGELSISYREALQRIRVPRVVTSALDPVSVLLAGLGGPATLAQRAGGAG